MGASERLRKAAGSRLLLLAIALVIGVVGAWPAFESEMTWEDVATDCDVVMLKRGLEQTPHFSDTFRWFTGYWIGCNPFWRPLSSYIFWTLDRVLGLEHPYRFEIVTGVGHIIVTGMLFWLVMVLTKRPLLGLLAVALSNLQLPGYTIGGLYVAPRVGPVAFWIYMPDLWLALVTLPALWLAWRGRLWWAVPLVAAAAMIKETGFVVFPLVMLFYWWRHRRLHPAFLALIAIAGVFAALKLTYVGPGWVLGSNRSIWTRMMRFAFPRPITYMLTGMAPWTITAIGVGVATITALSPPRRPYLSLGIIAGSFLVAVVTYHYTIGTEAGNPGLDIALAGVIDRCLLRIVPQVALWVVAAWAGLRGPDRSLVILLAITYLVLGFPSTLAPQTGIRSLYTAMLISSGISSVCVWSMPVVVGRPVRQQPLVEGFDCDGEE